MAKRKIMPKTKNQRNARLLDSGYHSQTLQANTKGKKIVVKKIPTILPKQEAEQTIRWHEKYLETLRRFGISFPETQVKMRPKEGGYTLTIFQERFEKNEIVSNILKHSPKEQALSLFRKLSQQCANLIKLNKAWKKDAKSSIEVDFHPRNFALRNGKLFLVDTFFPLIMIEGKSSLKLEKKYLDRNTTTIAKIHRALTGRLAFRLETPMIRLALHSIKTRPDLEKNFVEILKKTIRENFSPAEKAKLMKWLSPTRIKLLKAYLKLHRGFLGRGKD